MEATASLRNPSTTMTDEKQPYTDDIRQETSPHLPTSNPANRRRRSSIRHRRLSVPRALPKLFGLDEEKQQLFNTFQRSLDVKQSRQSELTIISGSSGSGKTALAQTLQEHAKHFLLAKCDQIQQGSEPFGPFVATLSQFANDLFLQDDEEIIQQIRSTAQQAIPDPTEATLLTDMVPALSEFFPNVTTYSRRNSTSAATTIQRSNVVENPTAKAVCKFLKSLCSPDHSIVMVIDDIQWIDQNSIELLELIVSADQEEERMAGFMLLVTCRDDEITDDHPFSQTIQIMKDNTNVTINDIHLGSLSIDTVCDLVVDTFPTLAGRDLDALSGVLQAHTKGNAFFTTQILQRLKNSGWKPPEYRGRINENSIGSWGSADEQSMIDHLTSLDCDSLVDIVVSDTANETPFMREVLKSSSCLGSDFATSHLMAVVDDSMDHVLEALALMETKGFIQPHDGIQGWSWTHDKFQKAAYLLLDSTERRSFHLRVGRCLLSSLDEEELDQYLFIVVSQFCISLDKIKEDDESARVAALLLQAAEKSAQASSFSKAASYLSMGTSLLKTDNWDSQYELSLHLYSAAAEMECCKGDFVAANKLMDVILRHTHTIMDKLRVYETKMYLYTAKGEFNKVVCLALEVLDQLGEKLPRKPGMASIIYEIMITRLLLSKKTVDCILNLQPISDWKTIAVIRIKQIAFLSVISASPELLPIFVCRSIRLTLKHGLCSMSSPIFANMCLILYHPLGRINEGNKCACIAEKMIDKFGVEEFFKCRVQTSLAAGSLPFKVPFRQMLKPLEDAGSAGFATGDIDFGCAALVLRVYAMFFCGERLDLVLSVTREYKKNFKRSGRRNRLIPLSVLLQAIENLNCTTNDPCIFTGEAMDEERWIERSEAINDQFEKRFFWLFKVAVAVYVGEYRKAQGFMKILKDISLKSTSGASLFQLFFFDALIDLFLAREDMQRNNNNDENNNRNGGGKRLHRVKNYKPSLKKLRLFSKSAPENANSKISLIEAEVAVLKNGGKGISTLAKLKFQHSIDEAHKHRLVHEEALAYERYAIALSEWGETSKALEYFERAKKIYADDWGAPVKVLQLIDFVKERSGVRIA